MALLLRGVVRVLVALWQVCVAAGDGGLCATDIGMDLGQVLRGVAQPITFRRVIVAQDVCLTAVVAAQPAVLPVRDVERQHPATKGRIASPKEAQPAVWHSHQQAGGPAGQRVCGARLVHEVLGIWHQVTLRVKVAALGHVKHGAAQAPTAYKVPVARRPLRHRVRHTVRSEVDVVVHLEVVLGAKQARRGLEVAQHLELQIVVLLDDIEVQVLPLAELLRDHLCRHLPAVCLAHHKAQLHVEALLESAQPGGSVGEPRGAARVAPADAALLAVREDADEREVLAARVRPLPRALVVHGHRMRVGSAAVGAHCRRAASSIGAASRKRLLRLGAARVPS
mmetsp:Transcript_37567/g.94940  ORF Transcript_37567/g.94940 Transcript_37567/m.94940 type:complete len:338 (-) Transcript_37567:320-1333(-)